MSGTFIESFMKCINCYDSLKSMPHYQILRCEANQNDCSYSWDVKLTEFGYCITSKKINAPAESNGKLLFNKT